jgi:hypothetical protein
LFYILGYLLEPSYKILGIWNIVFSSKKNFAHFSRKVLCKSQISGKVHPKNVTGDGVRRVRKRCPKGKLWVIFPVLSRDKV